MKTPLAPDPMDDKYARDRRRAEDDGTALPESTNDFAPADLYRAAKALAAVLAAGSPTVSDDLLQTIGLPDADPSRWERLDVARAAAWVRDNRPGEFAELTAAYPWLPDSADAGIGALSDAF